MAMIACDGACKRNGKPDCISAYGVAVHRKDMEPFTFCGHEEESTSQRGELHGVAAALEYGLELIRSKPQMIIIVTDSAYIRNCIKQQWYNKWRRNGWVTNTGDAVKNKDLWERIVGLLEQYQDDNFDIFQVKGHIDPKNEEKMLDAWGKCAEANDGVRPPYEVFQRMIILNNAADKTATIEAERANTALLKQVEVSLDRIWE